MKICEKYRVKVGDTLKFSTPSGDYEKKITNENIQEEIGRDAMCCTGVSYHEALKIEGVQDIIDKTFEVEGLRPDKMRLGFMGIRKLCHELRVKKVICE